MGEGPGGWHLRPSPQALGNLQEAPLQPVIWPRGESRGMGMDTVTIGSPKFPSLATGRVKCAPMGVGWGGALPPTPQSLAFILWVGFLFLDVHAPSEQMGEPVPMDGADDIEHSGFSEDLREQRTPQCPDLCLHLQPALPSSGRPHLAPGAAAKKNALQKKGIGGGRVGAGMKSCRAELWSLGPGCAS